MQTILGAGGVISHELTRSLRHYTPAIRLVSRSARAVEGGAEVQTADLLDGAATERAVADSEVVYRVAGLAYKASVWEQQWPRIMDNVIEACIRHGARLVFFDNVYAYGRVHGAMTEETPFNPVSRKGEVRARIATRLLDVMRAGQIEALIARAPDFYGPGAVSSFPHATVFARLRAGKAPQWVGNPTAVHTFIYTPDAGRAVAVLGQDRNAFGRTWHLPTRSESMSGAEFVRLACELAGVNYRIQPAPRWLLRLMGLFVPVLRENDEMLYQFLYDYRFDSTAIATAYGLTATPYLDGIAETLRANGIQPHSG